MSRPSNTKLLILFSTLTANYAKLDLELMMHVLFVMMNLRIYIAISMNALTPKRSGLISNCTGTSIGSANPSFCTKRFTWSFIPAMPFIKFIKLFHNNWKIIFVGLRKKPNTS